jgi:ribosomal protein S18 acetylase RimI-like enzyme
MNFTLIPLAQLDPTGLDSLAQLHHAVMHTLLSELGEPVVLRYYQACQNDPAVIGLGAVSPLPVGEEPGARVLGWAVGSPHPDQLNARLRQPLPWFAGQMLRLAFTRPGVLAQLAASLLSAAGQMEAEPGAIELTYIGVAASARGQGLGKALLAAFVDAARAAGYRSVSLSVETDNPAAVALYTQASFRITKTFNEGRFQRHRMELLIHEEHEGLRSKV